MNLSSSLNRLRSRLLFTRPAGWTLCAFALIIIVTLLLLNYLSNKNTPTPPEDLEKLYEKGISQMKAGNYDEAIKTMTTVGQYAGAGHTLQDSIMAAKAYNNAGAISFFSNNYPAAYSFYSKALEAGGTRHGYYVQTNLAIIHKMFNDTRSTERLLLEAYRLAKEAQDTLHLTLAYNNILNLSVLEQLEHKDSISGIIRDYRNLNHPGNAKSYMDWITDGVSAYLATNYEKSIFSFQQAERLANETRSPQRARIDCNMYIAQCFMDQQQQDSALLYLEKAAILSGAEGVRDHLTDIYLRITECYDRLGRPEDAMRSKMTYYKLRDSVSSFEDLTAIKNMDADYQVRNYENRLAAVVAKKQSLTLKFITVAIFLVITLILLGIIYVQKKKVYRQNLSLYNKNIQLLETIENARNEYISQKEEREKISPASEADEDPTPDCIPMIIPSGIEGNEMPGVPSEQEKLLEDKADEESVPTGSVNIPEEEETRIAEAIQNFFYTSQEYLSTDFNLRRLCEIVGSNRLYVSYVINNNLKTSFHTLLNEYRINEAKKRLIDNEKFGQLTIESIATSVGYKSRSNFTRNFKASTGLTPSEFITISKTVKK